MYNNLLVILLLAIIKTGCTNFNKEQKIISQETIVSSAKVKESNSQEPQEKDMRSLLDSLVFDTTSTIESKFRLIFSSSLFASDKLDNVFIKDSLFRELSHHSCGSKDYFMIAGYDALQDSIFSNKINLEPGAIKYFKDSRYASYRISLKNGDSLEYKWKSSEEKLYDFVGYYPEIGYYRFSENYFEGGIVDFMVNASNGEELEFIPNFSCNGEVYHDIETGQGYADINFINLILGKDLSSPIINKLFEYYPLSSNNDGFDSFEEYPENARFNIEDITWVNSHDIIFQFNHTITKKTDTLFYENTNVKITMKTR